MKYLISAGSVLSEHMLLRADREGKSANRISSDIQLTVETLTGECCSAGKPSGTPALPLPELWRAFPTPSLEPGLKAWPLSPPQCLGLKIQQSNLPLCLLLASLSLP